MSEIEVIPEGCKAKHNAKDTDSTLARASKQYTRTQPPQQGGDVGEALAGMEKAIYKLRGLEAEPMYKDQRLVSSVWAIRDDKIEPIEQGLKFYMDKIRAHLTQAQEQQTAVIPEGYALVPLQLTEKMAQASDMYEHVECFDDVQKIWEWMIGAAPAATITKAEG
mgnify:CR=1 FL=1